MPKQKATTKDEQSVVRTDSVLKLCPNPEYVYEITTQECRWTSKLSFDKHSQQEELTGTTEVEWHTGRPLHDSCHEFVAFTGDVVVLAYYDVVCESRANAVDVDHQGDVQKRGVEIEVSNYTNDEVLGSWRIEGVSNGMILDLVAYAWIHVDNAANGSQEESHFDIVFSSDDGHVWLLSLIQDVEAFELTQLPMLMNHHKSVNRLLFVDNSFGELVLGITDNNTAMIWNVQSKNLIKTVTLQHVPWLLEVFIPNEALNAMDRVMMESIGIRKDKTNITPHLEDKILQVFGCPVYMISVQESFVSVGPLGSQSLVSQFTTDVEYIDASLSESLIYLLGLKSLDIYRLSNNSNIEPLHRIKLDSDAISIHSTVLQEDRDRVLVRLADGLILFLTVQVKHGKKGSTVNILNNKRLINFID